jgi:cell division protein FtsN
MSEAKRTSPWVWVTLFLIVALFATFILFLDQKIVKSGRSNTQVSRPENNTSGPVIDFYEVLKDRRFDVPEDRTEQVRNSRPKPNKGSSQDRFILQAGSFRSSKDAERRKAELALLGLQADVKAADVNGVDYYRIELGPFADDGAFSKARNTLISNDISYISKTFK